jgi:hypothetical protein
MQNSGTIKPEKKSIISTKPYFCSACLTHFIINQDEDSAIQKGAFHFKVMLHTHDIA